MSSNLDFVIENGVLKKYSGPGGDVVIPESVTEIGSSAFWDCTCLKSVTIPAGVTEIGSSAFWDCTCLKSVTIPAGVTRIGSSAFSGCTGLTSVTIPAGVTEIGSSAFSGCTGLTSVTIPAGVTEIGSSAFSHCTGLTSVTIPEGVKKIGWHAFEGCTGLIRVTIPEGVTEIHRAAFVRCTGLTSVTIPESVTEIGEFAFSDCTGLTGVTIPAGVTKIGWSAFEGCTGLTSVNIPESVTEIDDRTFSGCTGLTSVTILAGVTKIGRFAFSDCTGLESITILGRPEISKETFPDSVTVIVAEQLRMSDYPAPAYKQMAARGFALRYGSGEVLPEDYRADCLKYIRGQKKKFYPMALQDPALLHVMLAEQIIPKGDLPDLIDWAAAAGSAEVTAMLLDYQDKQLKPGERQKLEEQKMQREIEFMLTGTLTAAEAKKSWRYEKNENGNLTILDYKGGKTEVEVPTVIGKDSVTKIGSFAFWNCTCLTSVTIPAGVTEICNSAFSGCTGLTSVTIPDSVTKIDGYAFKDCTGLTSVTIPDSVTKIDGYAFKDCTGLESITILGRPKMDKEAFSDPIAPIVAEQFRMSDYPTPAYKQAAARGFALQYGTGEALPEAYRADCLKYIKSQKKKLYPMALQDSALLHVMLTEQIIPKGDLPDLIDQAAAADSAEITAMLLIYQEGQLKPGERKKLEELKM